MTSFLRGSVPQWGSSFARCKPTDINLAPSVFAEVSLGVETHSRNSKVQGEVTTIGLIPGFWFFNAAAKLGSTLMYWSGPEKKHVRLAARTRHAFLQVLHHAFAKTSDFRA